MNFGSLATQLASTSEATGEKTDILTGLGIDWTLLALQLVAFLLLVWALSKFVYPVFMRIIDQRQAKIDEGLAAARQAEDNAAATQAKTDEQLAIARKEAKEIVATAKDEASAMVAKANEKAKTQAEHLIDSAKDDIAKEVLSARKTLRNDTVELVAEATGKVVDSDYSAGLDRKLIDNALKEAK